MRGPFKQLSLTSLATLPLLLSAQAASAHYSRWEHRHSFDDDSGSLSRVPEIDVTAGLAAGAALGAILLLVWEIRRRRKQS